MEKTKYQGTALHEQLGERGRASGELSFSSNHLIFQNSEIIMEIPVSGIKIERVRSGVELYYFSHSDYPDWSFYTPDVAILSNENVRDNALSVKIKTTRSRRSVMTISSILLIIILLPALYLVVLRGKDVIVGALVTLVPVDLEIKLGELVFMQYSMEFDLVENEEIDKMLKDLTEPLVSALPDKRYPFVFHVSKDAQMNAFALPGGNVILTMGLIEVAHSPEEILGVVSHEIAHVQKRHTISQLMSSIGLYGFIQLFFGDIGGMIEVILSNGSFLLTQSFSREHELEADRMGFSYLVDAGINPQGMVSLFETFEKEASENDNGLLEKIEQIERSLSFLNTHPQTSERIDILSKEIEKLSEEIIFSEIVFDLPAFKEAVFNIND